MAEAQYTRAGYLAELEEQRILASLQRQEALHQADFRQRYMFAAQHDIARRRTGHTYAQNLCRPVASPQGRRHAFVRRQRENSFPAYEPQNPLINLEAIISALLDGGDEHIAESEKVNIY